MKRWLEMQGSRGESLYKALSGDRSPDFDTVLRVMAALGLRLHAKPPKAELDGAAVPCLC